MNGKLIQCCCIIFLLTCKSLLAQTDISETEFEFDLDLSVDPITTQDSAANATQDLSNTSITHSIPSAFRFSVDHEFSANPKDYDGLINNRFGIQIEYDKLIAKNVFAKLDAIGNLYTSQDHVSESANKRYQTYGRIKEAWLQRSWDSLNLKFGKQNIVWSEVDSSRATDNINPVDNSELLFIDFEDARLGQWMLSGNYYADDGFWEGFINLLPLFDRLPPAESIYSFGLNFPIDKVADPDPEAGVRLKIKWGPAEIAFLVANLIPNQPTYQLVISDVNLQRYRFRELAPRFWLSGINANLARGKALWKADIAYKTDQAYNAIQTCNINNIDCAPSSTVIKKDVFDFAVGLEYTTREHRLDFSITRTLIRNWHNDILTEAKTGLFLLSWSKNYLHEELSLSASVGKIYRESSQYASVYADYAYDDNLGFIASLYWFDIDTNNMQLSPLHNNNRLSVKIKYQM